MDRRAGGGAPGGPPSPPEGPPALSDWEVERLAEHLDELLVGLIERGDQAIATSIVGLLEGIERLHAEAVRRLAELLARDADLFGRARRDPVVSALFDLYDISVAGAAQAGGAAAELDPGGVSPTGDTSIVPGSRLVQLRRRLEEGAGASARGGEGGEADPRVGVVDLDEFGDRDMLGVSVGRVSVLLVRTESGVRAYRNACPGSPLPLHLGTLENGALVCPWHGCRFDVESGERRGDEGSPLRALATSAGEDRIRIVLP